MSNLPPVEKRKTLEDLIAEDARSPIPTLVQPNTITGNLPPPQNLTGPRLAAPGPTAPAPRQASPFPTLNFPMRFENPQAPRGMVPPSNTPSPAPMRPGGPRTPGPPTINMQLPSPQFATPTPSPGMGFPTPVKHPTPSPGLSPLLNPGLGKRLPGVTTGKRKTG